MASAARRLRPPARFSGNCSPRGRAPALRMRAGERFPSPPIGSPSSLWNGDPAHSGYPGECGTDADYGQATFSAESPPKKQFPPGFPPSPPCRMSRGSAWGRESRIPPSLPAGSATYSGWSSLAAPLGTAARRVPPACSPTSSPRSPLPAGPGPGAAEAGRRAGGEKGLTNQGSRLGGFN